MLFLYFHLSLYLTHVLPHLFLNLYFHNNFYYLKLVKLTKLDRDELLDELKSKIAIIEDCTKVINDKVYRNSKIAEKVKAMKKEFGFKVFLIQVIYYIF